MGSVDRRSLLRIIGAGGVAGVGAVTMGAPSVSASPAARSFVLLSPRLHSSLRATHPEVGSSSMLTGDITDETGAKLGQFHATRVVLESGPTTELTHVDQHVFRLANGTLLGSGVSTRSRTVVDSFAVTGGTGVYANARGTYRVQHDDWHMGGDGSCRFDIDLTKGN
jgi:hypothetical protein